MKITVRLFKRKQNGIWYVEYDSGKRHSLKTREAGLARQMYRKLEREYLNRKVSRLLGECTTTIGRFRNDFLEWAEAVQPKSTYRANKLALDKLVEQCGETCLLDRVSAKHIDQMVAQHLSRGIKPASINNYIRHAKSCLNKAKEWGLISGESPLKSVKEIPGRRSLPAYMKKDELSRFLATIEDPALHQLITAYIVTGRRRSELLGLEWRDVDLKARKYTIRRSKSRQDQTYTINAMFMKVLQVIDEGEPHEKVFDKWSHPDTVSHMVKAALVAAGYGHLRLHSLRHTYASMMAEGGLTLFEIQGLLGHSDIKATAIYAHLTDDHLAGIGEVNIGPVDLRRVK